MSREKLTQEEHESRRKGKAAAAQLIRAIELEPGVLERLRAEEALYDACEHEWYTDGEFYTCCAKCGWSIFDAEGWASTRGITE